MQYIFDFLNRAHSNDKVNDPDSDSDHYPSYPNPNPNPNPPRPHLHSNSLTALSALRRQSHRTHHLDWREGATGGFRESLSFLLPATTPGIPSRKSPRRIPWTQPSSPTQHPLALIRTLQAEARARPVTEALPQLMGAMTFQRKLPFFPLHLLWISMQTAPYEDTFSSSTFVRSQPLQPEDPHGSMSTALSSSSPDVGSSKNSAQTVKVSVTPPYSAKSACGESLPSATPFSQMSSGSILPTGSWREATEDLVIYFESRESTRQEALEEIVASEERYGFCPCLLNKSR